MEYKRRGRVLAITELSWSLSFIVGVPLMGLLIARYGWTAPFPVLTLLGLLAFGVLAWMLPGDARLIAADLAAWDWVLIAAFASGIILVAATSPEPVSYCDTSPDRLDRARVNAGLVTGWLAAVQALVTDGASAWLETPIWVCMIAVLVSSAERIAKRRPGNTR